MIVVSNTSPLTNLGAIGQLDLLRRLYGAIHIPHAVFAELHSGGKTWPGGSEVAAASWITKHQVQDAVLTKVLTQSLGPGESEAIALAMELGADLVLLDERDGRAAAANLGLRVTGVCGTLVAGKARGEIAHVAHELDRLKSIGFYLSSKTIERALSLAGELIAPT